MIDADAGSRTGATSATPTGVALELKPRHCPVCGSDAVSAVLEARLDTTRLGPLAFASRKPPELMHHRLLTCASCDLLYASPAPTAATLEAAYAQAAYDSAESAAYAARTYATFLPGLLAGIPSDGPALDIGAGDGAFLAELIAAGLDDVIGVEPSPAAAASADTDVRGRIRQTAFRAHEFQSGRFRLVTALQTLEHVPDPLAVCGGAHDLLCESGALMVVCHNRRAPVNRIMGRHSPIVDVQHLQLFSPRSLRALLERAGLADVELRPVHNRYPLRSWLRLAPAPAGVKRRLLGWLPDWLAGTPLALPAGNLAAIGYRRAR